MAPRNDDFVRITEREWGALTRSIERLSKSVEQIEREQLVFKTKAGVYLGLITGAGVAVQIVIKFLT